MSKTRVDQVRDTYSSDAAQAQRSVRGAVHDHRGATSRCWRRWIPKERTRNSLTASRTMSSGPSHCRTGRWRGWTRSMEKVMKAAGLPSVPRHMDRRRKGITMDTREDNSMKTPKDLREASRIMWTNDKPATTENITLGCILRIADASELMAKNHKQLVDERDRYKNCTKRSATLCTRGTGQYVDCAAR